VAVCATTGIAAQLLREGTTVHRRFGPIPSPLKPDSAVFLDANDPRIELFYHADVIIIDECSGMHVVSNSTQIYLKHFIKGFTQLSQQTSKHL
jgi:hypothetical protein